VVIRGEAQLLAPHKYIDDNQETAEHGAPSRSYNELYHKCIAACQLQASDPSSPAESYGDFTTFDYDRDLAVAAGELEHLLHGGRIGLDVPVFEGDLSLGVVLTGRRRVGSRVLSENQNLVTHLVASLPAWH